jgi:4-hydroxybenzoyl-CoA thioesterase
VHVHRLTVRFGDCDPAGIAYFPRIHDWFHQGMETWFDRALGHPYAQVIRVRQLGFPTARIEADFARPCALGDALALELRLAAVGRSSVSLAFTLRGADAAEVRATARSVVVALDLDPASPTHGRAVPLPDDLRAAMLAFGVHPLTDEPAAG